jgi:hypothetical protein
MSLEKWPVKAEFVFAPWAEDRAELKHGGNETQEGAGDGD